MLIISLNNSTDCPYSTDPDPNRSFCLTTQKLGQCWHPSLSPATVLLCLPNLITSVQVCVYLCRGIFIYMVVSVRCSFPVSYGASVCILKLPCWLTSRTGVISTAVCLGILTWSKKFSIFRSTYCLWHCCMPCTFMQVARGMLHMESFASFCLYAVTCLCVLLRADLILVNMLTLILQNQSLFWEAS